MNRRTRCVPIFLVAIGAIGVVAQEAERPSFAEFLAGIREDAIARGIAPATVDSALTGLHLEPVVVARDRAQPEQSMSLDAYLARRLTVRITTTAREKARVHRAVLAEVEKAYGVPAAVVTAIWGLESSFGQFTGTYPTVRALATLAYDARRPLFRTELLHALAILDRGDVRPDELKGSWAGAMGQPQFMPSSFLDRAVDFDRDGHTDIWRSMPDVFASMASYLKGAGWEPGERWGREVGISRAVMDRIEQKVPMRTLGCRAERAMTGSRPLSAWRALGVTLPGGAALPASEIEASLVRGERRHFLAYRNYAALLKYNCSNPYAVSVGLLADKIDGK